MKFIKFLVVASVLTARICQSAIVIPTPSPDESTSDLAKDLVKIVTSCYGDRLHTVGLAGSLPDTLSTKLSTEHSIPVVLIDDARNDTDNASFVPVQFRHKIHVFIVEASTWNQLHVIIENIKIYIWWNHMASFLIVDRSPGCVNVRHSLLVAWQHDILNAKVLCYGNESATIYNYNPFTDQAPIPWKLYKVLKIKKGVTKLQFALFYRKYRGNKSICINLDFDKTKDLGGYEIGVDRPDISYIKSPKIYKIFIWQMIPSENIVSTVCRALNGTVKFANEIYSGTMPINTDIGVFSNSIHVLGDKNNFIRTYPHTLMIVVLVSQFRDNRSQLKEILCVIDVLQIVVLQIGTAIMGFMTFIFLKFIAHQATIPTISNIIRITWNTRFTNLPDSAAWRTFTSCLLLCSLIMQVIVWCKLSVRLTTKIPLKNVNTYEDIEMLGYKLCGKFADTDFSERGLIKRNLIQGESEDCYRYMEDDPSIVYLNNGIFLTIEEAHELNLHVSRKYLSTDYQGLPIRWNWALEQTFNRMIAKLVEADALEPWNRKFPTMGFPVLSDVEKIKYAKDYKPLNFDELKFAFIILCAGIASAIVSFIFELVIGYKCTCGIMRKPRQLSYTVLTDRINHSYNIIQNIKRKYFR